MKERILPRLPEHVEIGFEMHYDFEFNEETAGEIADALIEAGIRDVVIYIIGGWGITQEWCDSVGADAFGENAADALDKVKALLRGDLPRWQDRVKK